MKKDFLRVGLLLGVALGFLLPHLGEFAYPFGSQYSDLVISHYPNWIFIQQSILKDHQLPLWSNAILSGYPFVANPLAGMGYLPTWLGVFLPVPLGANFLVLIHLICGGTGMFFFLKDQGRLFWAAALGGLSFALMPKLFAHYAAGHVTLIFAICWTPWLLWAERMRFQTQGSKTFRVYAVLPGLALGIIFLADPRWAVYAGGLWLLYALFMQRERSILSPKGGLDSGVGGRYAGLSWGQWATSTVLQIFIGLALAAPLLLPLIQFSRLSTRSLMVPADNLTLSLDFFRLVGLVVPDMAGYAEFVIYPGALLLAALVWTLCNRKARRTSWFWMAVFLMAMLFSLGGNIPLMPFLARLPGMRLLRVPSRAVFVAGFALSVVFANSVDLWISPPVGSRKEETIGNLLLAGLAGFVALLTAGIWFLSGTAPLEFMWGSAALLFSVVWIIYNQKGKMAEVYFLSGLVLIICLDLGGIGYSQLKFHSRSEIMEEKAELADVFPEVEESFRIYSPSYSIPQHTGVLNEWELADGIDPMQLLAYVDFMEEATDIPNSAYSVTLPPFSSGNPSVDNQGALSNAALLGLLNVKYVAAQFPVSAHGLTLLTREGETWIYENEKVMPRAWVEKGNNSMGGEAIVPAWIRHRTPNQISLEAEGPGLLVLSEISYPGWQVHVDGQRALMERPWNILRGVKLNAGIHQVEFKYRPLMLYAGLLIELLLLGVILFFIWNG